MRPAACPLADAARDLSLPLAEGGVENFAEMQDLDAVIACDYGALLPASILGAARRGALNIHPSLLPRWRGAAPHRPGNVGGR